MVVFRIDVRLDPQATCQRRDPGPWIKTVKTTIAVANANWISISVTYGWPRSARKTINVASPGIAKPLNPISRSIFMAS